MRFDVVFFDFDGTLIDSAGAKREAFFRIFPSTAEHRATVATVLDADPEASRHVVIPRMVAAIQGRGLPLPAGRTAADLVRMYGEEALALAGRCPEMAGAEAMLRRLAGKAYRVIVSVTPQPDLETLLARRGWRDLVDEVHGFPAVKAEVVNRVLADRGIDPGRAIVVGDGTGDRAAAEANGCAFFAVGPDGLAGLPSMLGLEHVCG